MSELPRHLSPGTRLTARWLNRLLDFLRARELRAGPGIRLCRTPTGTTISAAPGPEERRRHMPFDCRAAATEDGAVRTLCYVPERGEGLVRLEEQDGSRLVRFHADGRTVRDDWLDCGTDLEPVCLFPICDDDAETKDAQIASLRYAVGASPPSSYRLASLVSDKIVLAEWTERGLEQRVHGFVRLGRPRPRLDSDEEPEDPAKEPGESLGFYAATQGGEDGPLQLRQFHDPADTQGIKPLNAEEGTASEETPDATNLHILMRKIGPRTQTGGEEQLRPKLVYVPASDSPFWLTGGDDTTNYGTAVRIGSAETGYVRIYVTSPG